jgi:hypothetical protein
MVRHGQISDDSEWDRALRTPFAFTGQVGARANGDHWVFGGNADAGIEEIESAGHDSDMLDLLFGRMIDDGAAFPVRVRAALPQAGRNSLLTRAGFYTFLT